MFCPKCGIENPDNGKFCRGCRANLSKVLAVVDDMDSLSDEIVSKDNYAKNYSAGIRNTIIGAGFLVTAIFMKSIPGVPAFWILMLIPGFIFIAFGVSRLVKDEELKKERELPTNAAQQPDLQDKQQVSKLTSNQTEYINPTLRFATNDLAIPSVTEDTTKQLKQKD